MKRIGITGGIGSGKSTVSAYLRAKGYQVVDADQVARDVVKPEGDVLNQLVREFGEEILSDDGTLNRKKLAGMTFDNSIKKQKLDSLTHGAILREIRKRLDELDRAGVELAFVDAALLVETGLHQDMDMIWLVAAEEARRIDRVSSRDGLAPSEVKKRMDHQLGDTEKARVADEVILNDDDIKSLKKKTDKLLEGLG